MKSPIYKGPLNSFDLLTEIFFEVRYILFSNLWTFASETLKEVVKVKPFSRSENYDNYKIQIR